MVTPTENWPKTFLLQCHEEAVKNGVIFVEPITEADAESLKSRLYRIRRRSDKSMAAFIPQEYHLVMIGVWEPGPDGTGRLPIIFDKRSDGQPLPSLRAATGEEIEAALPAPKPATPPPIIDFESIPAADLEMKPEEITGYVEGLRSKARKKEQ